MKRVAILLLGQTTDHKQTRILRTEKLDLADPFQKLLTLLIRWLLVLVFRRHLVGFYHGNRLFPPFAGGSFAGLLECWSEVDSALLSILPVTARAVGFHEWRDHVFEGLPGIDLQCLEICVVRGLCCATQGQWQRKGNEGHRHHAAAKCSGSLHSFLSSGGKTILEGSAYALAELRRVSSKKRYGLTPHSRKPVSKSFASKAIIFDLDRCLAAPDEVGVVRPGVCGHPAANEEV